MLIAINEPIILARFNGKILKSIKKSMNKINSIGYFKQNLIKLFIY